MHMLTFAAFLLVLLLGWGGGTALSGGPVAAQVDNELQENQAQQKVEAGLALMDRGDYDSSWDQAAAFFRRSVARERWREAAAKLRGPIGKLISRRFKTRQYNERLPGAPAGQYVVFSYRSDFEDRKGVEETVTSVFDGTRGWRVAGYKIQ